MKVSKLKYLKVLSNGSLRFGYKTLISKVRVFVCTKDNINCKLNAKLALNSKEPYSYKKIL